ncbi:unnamed protein product [Caenorhabditis brenneri]
MVVLFATMGIIFSGWELLAQPFMHNYNKALVYFSLGGQSQKFLQFSIALYAGFYEAIIAFIAVQFVFRYSTLFSPKIAEKFDGIGTFFWLLYPVIPGTVYGGSLYLYVQPDRYGDDYLREVMLTNYELAINEVPRFVIVSYNNSPGWCCTKSLQSPVRRLMIDAGRANGVDN